MTVYTFLWGVRILTWFSTLIWLAVLILIDPDSSQWVGLSLFYFSLFFTLTGWTTLFLNRLREFFLGEEEGQKKIEMSIREGILISFCCIVILFLQGKGFLTWWITAFIITGFLLVELYFLWKDE